MNAINSISTNDKRGTLMAKNNKASMKLNNLKVKKIKYKKRTRKKTDPLEDMVFGRGGSRL